MVEKFMAWGRRQKLASRAIAAGDLDLAVSLIMQAPMNQSFQGRRMIQRLTDSLLQRAKGATLRGNFPAAWKDLSLASDVALSQDKHSIAHHKNQLIELTFEAAESFLSSGKTRHAVELIQQLNDQKIMDWRSQRIQDVADQLHMADRFIETGKLTDALTALEYAKQLRPDLELVNARLDSTRQRQIELDQLMGELQKSALKCDWPLVNQLCRQILAISPKHQIALDAQRHSSERMKRKTVAGIRATRVPDKNRITESNSFFQPQLRSDQPASEPASSHDSDDPSDQSGCFMLWVDGVGGYLVCTETFNTIGQAVPFSNISIPMQGDLRRRHARIELVDGQHLLRPLGQISTDGQTVASPIALKHQQVIALDGDVRLKYLQSHPLSKTARLDFESRHRTRPWSDAVLLMSKTIILGPNRNNHIYCPTWKLDLMLFERDGKLFCRSQHPFEIDDQPIQHEGEIGWQSRIAGDDFSLTLEPLSGGSCNLG